MQLCTSESQQSTQRGIILSWTALSVKPTFISPLRKHVGMLEYTVDYFSEPVLCQENLLGLETQTTYLLG